MKWTLIYIDDQIDNIECFSELLADKFNVLGSTNVNDCDSLITDNFPHAILLDVHMPQKNGYTLYQEIISHPLYNKCPIFFISGDPSDEIKIRSFQEGGVDFLPRDIKGEEMIIRLSNKICAFLQMATKLKLGNLSLDFESLKAQIDDRNIDLTLLEFRLLGTILRAFPQKVARQDLILKVWGNAPIKPGTVNTHLTNLKPKIAEWNYQTKVREDFVILLKDS